MIDVLTKRRFLISFMIITVCFGILTARLVYIICFPTQTVSVGYSEKSGYYGSGRGQIYDCNLNKLVENTLVNETVELMGEEIGTVNYYSRYSDKQTLCHIIGYLDGENKVGVSGIEKDYDSLLNCSNFVKFNYYTDAQGRLLGGDKNEADYSEYNNTTGVQLTIDRDIQIAADTAGAELEKGAVVVSDLQGDIKAISSFPSFNPNNLSEYVDAEDQPLYNRALSNYAVGSVFKVLVCAAALEMGISENYTHLCTGYEYCGGVRFNCHKEDGHGKLNMKQALALSCNAYFINLAQKVGAERILSLAKKFGIDTQTVLSQSIISPAGTLPDMSVLSSPAGLANFSFGQGELTASPLKMCSIYTAIANGGKLYEQRLVQATVDSEMNVSRLGDTKSFSTVLSEDTCRKIRSFLKYTVEYGTGMSAKPDNVSAAGKTATAQTGVYNDNGVEKLNSWFIGYVPADNPEYVITVIKEGGTSGSGDCAPVFKEIAESIYDNDK